MQLTDDPQASASQGHNPFFHPKAVPARGNGANGRCSRWVRTQGQKTNWQLTAGWEIRANSRWRRVQANVTQEGLGGTGRHEYDMLNTSTSAFLKWDPLEPYRYLNISVTAVVIGFWAWAKNAFTRCLKLKSRGTNFIWDRGPPQFPPEHKGIAAMF